MKKKTKVDCSEASSLTILLVKLIYEQIIIVLSGSYYFEILLNYIIFSKLSKL